MALGYCVVVSSVHQVERVDSGEGEIPLRHCIVDVEEARYHLLIREVDISLKLVIIHQLALNGRCNRLRRLRTFEVGFPVVRWLL